MFPDVSLRRSRPPTALKLSNSPPSANCCSPKALKLRRAICSVDRSLLPAFLVLGKGAGERMCSWLVEKPPRLCDQGSSFDAPMFGASDALKRFARFCVVDRIGRAMQALAVGPVQRGSETFDQRRAK